MEHIRCHAMCEIRSCASGCAQVSAVVQLKRKTKGTKRFYLMTHSTHFILRKEGKVLFNDTLNTFFLRNEGKVFI